MQYNKVFAEWLGRRKITLEVMKLFNIHTAVHPSLGECIVIPVHDEHGVFSFNKYRRNPLDDRKPKYLYDKGGHLCLYGYSYIETDNPIIITEGEMDALVCWSHNIQAVSSTGGAMSFKDEWLPMLGDAIFICFDNDETGGEGMARVWKMFKDKNLNVVFLPDRPGVKDISDYVTNGGDLHELLKTARVFQSVEDVRQDRSVRVAHWQSTFFHDAVIKDAERNVPAPRARSKDKNDSLMNDRIMRAKEFPIDSIVDFVGGKAPCVWHKERSGSMHYYKDNNRVYCFGCGKGGDAIDVYKVVNNVGFNEAVSALQ